jgi:hypothetical protein
MFKIIRLVTVHPFLVHFTIGIVPVMVLAYAAAVWLKSERWSFTGDAATVVCAGISLLTTSFGPGFQFLPAMARRSMALALSSYGHGNRLDVGARNIRGDPIDNASARRIGQWCRRSGHFDMYIDASRCHGLDWR